MTSLLPSDAIQLKYYVTLISIADHDHHSIKVPINYYMDIYLFIHYIIIVPTYIVHIYWLDIVLLLYAHISSDILPSPDINQSADNFFVMYSLTLVEPK